MTGPWLKHAGDRADLRWERDAGGDWILVGRNPDGNPVAVRTERAPSVRTAAYDDHWINENRHKLRSFWD